MNESRGTAAHTHLHLTGTHNTDKMINITINNYRKETSQGKAAYQRSKRFRQEWNLWGKCPHSHLQKIRVSCCKTSQTVIRSNGSNVTWNDEAGSDVEVQSESKHVVDTVHAGDLQQLEQRALPLLLALISDGVITAQHHGASPSLMGLRGPRIQLPLARLHIRFVKLLQDRITSEN